jgi:hypothetical protein
MDILFEEKYDKQLMQRAVFLATAPSRRDTLIRWGICLMIILGTPYVFYEALSTGDEMTLSWLARRLMVLAIGLYYLIAPYARQWRNASDMWKKEESSPVTSGRITSQGISYDNGDAEVSYPWADFVRLREDTKLQLLVLRTANGTMVALAPRFFANEQDWARAEQLVRLKVVQPA